MRCPSLPDLISPEFERVDRLAFSASYYQFDQPDALSQPALNDVMRCILTVSPRGPRVDGLWEPARTDYYRDSNFSDH